MAGGVADALTSDWPAPMRQNAAPFAGVKGAAGSLDGAAGKLGAIAHAAEHAASAVQSLKKGGAQALLAPIAQAGMAKVATTLPGGATVLNTYAAISAGKPAAAIASTLGLPGSLPRIDAEVPSLIPKKSVI